MASCLLVPGFLWVTGEGKNNCWPVLGCRMPVMETAQWNLLGSQHSSTPLGYTVWSSQLVSVAAFCFFSSAAMLSLKAIRMRASALLTFLTHMSPQGYGDWWDEMVRVVLSGRGRALPLHQSLFLLPTSNEVLWFCYE